MNNRGWIWYFVVLGALTLLATSVLVVYNLRQQLKPEELEAARHTWKNHGLRDYHLVYTIRINEEPNADRYEVWVVGGRATRVLVNGREDDRLHWYGMEKLFGYIETNLERDGNKGQPRSYTRAIFDHGTGALRWYVRRVMGSRERVEMTIEKLEST